MRELQADQINIPAVLKTAEFLSNDINLGRKVLSHIESELKECSEFLISVAFITLGGIQPLLQTLKDLEEQGIPGKILTTDYLMFNHPNVLDKLMCLKNIELRMYRTNKQGGFHTKGYIFRNKSDYQIIIGSSNLTANALTINKEWNVKINSATTSGYTKDILQEFYSIWESPYTYKYEDVRQKYQQEFELSKKINFRNSISLQSGTTEIFLSPNDGLTPNSMQINVIQSLKRLINLGEHRGLLISATGTGKTYAAAFGIKEVAPKRILFLIHREQIAKQALDSFSKVLGNSYEYGLLSGNSKDYNSTCLFATMQMMGKESVRKNFSPEDFDFILIDEVHRAGSSSYQDIIDYFKPKFLMGMTASPERTDSYDIYNLFNHNIIYEIRLQQALEENLLCPFHYFGVTDLTITSEESDAVEISFTNLTSDARVTHILEKAEYFGFSGNRVKGLIFCSRKDEAKKLSELFNMRGYRTVCLSGEDSQEVREQCIKRLSADDIEDPLDYIFTVDIFNEGIDIPAINQVIMLRPTESPIVFIQQLGRGLRKYNQKEFVVIIDFIGNYNSNFMIPIALSGDKTYNKDNLRRYIESGNCIIPGQSTIHFDQISKKRIYKSIDVANFSAVKLIKDSYIELKNKLGRIPSLKDFEDHGSMDVLCIFENDSLGSYHMFKKKYEKSYKVSFTLEEEEILEYISKKFASGIRPHELMVLQKMIKNNGDTLRDSLREIEAYDYQITENTYQNIINILTANYITGTGKKYANCIFIKMRDIDREYIIADKFKAMLENDEFFVQVLELIDFGLNRYQKLYRKHVPNKSFCLNAKYSYDDVCRLLEWPKNVVAQNIGGYKYDEQTKTYPVFINYHKSENISATIQYEDQFLNPSLLQAISKSKRTIKSKDVNTALNADNMGISMDLFVRKNNEDKGAKEFYYLGPIHAEDKVEEIVMADGKTKAVKLLYKLDYPVRDDIYDYLLNG